MVVKFGSVCSGIEAASVSFAKYGWKATWFSEIEPFASAVLSHHYPNIPNLGDMQKLPDMILNREIIAPEVFCGGCPCQSFSLAGNRKSLDDSRGNLTLTFCEIADAIDQIRKEDGKQPSTIFYENVPGILSTHDGAFGCFLAALAGEVEPLMPSGKKWSNAGLVFGPKRAIAWRVLDAQYFGLPQRRKRVFVVASARKGISPAEILFEFDRLSRDTSTSHSKRKETTRNVGTSVVTGNRGNGRKPLFWNE